MKINQKMMNKKFLMNLSMIALMVTSTVVIAWAYVLWSNVVSASTDFSITLSQGVNYNEITLTATVMNNGLPVDGGIVSFYQCSDALGSNPVKLVDGDISITNGIAQYFYLADANGERFFRASYTVQPQV